jgi:hypothetical protein
MSASAPTDVTLQRGRRRPVCREASTFNAVAAQAAHKDGDGHRIARVPRVALRELGAAQLWHELPSSLSGYSP